MTTNSSRIFFLLIMVTLVPSGCWYLPPAYPIEGNGTEPQIESEIVRQRIERQIRKCWISGHGIFRNSTLRTLPPTGDVVWRIELVAAQPDCRVELEIQVRSDKGWAKPLRLETGGPMLNNTYDHAIREWGRGKTKCETMFVPGLRP